MKARQREEALRASVPPVALVEPSTVMDAVKGRDLGGKRGRLTHRHLDGRDRALNLLDQAAAALDQLVAVEESGLSTELSPRISRVRELAGTTRHIGRQLDATYV